MRLDPFVPDVKLNRDSACKSSKNRSSVVSVSALILPTLQNAMTATKPMDMVTFAREAISSFDG